MTESAKAIEPTSVPLALYVHIPWCERKCPYCDFNSHEQFDPALEGDYVAALLEDLRQQLSSGGSNSDSTRLLKRDLTSVFIGGGTPSLFSGGAIGELLEGIDQLMSLGNAEVTLESNPGSAESSRYSDYRAAGVNRLSIGVQSFNDASLKQLGRIHDADRARQATQLAACYFDRVNLDLMHGLPEQDVSTAMSDLEEAIARCSGHLSWYQLTIEPNTAFWSRPPEIPVEDVLADIQDAGELRLHSAGFQQYEVSAWCQPGQESRHNLNYWTFGDYLGIGAGAHGKLTQTDGAIIRTRRTRLPADYLAAIRADKPIISAPITEADLSGEFMLNVLRLKAGAARDLFIQRTGLTPDALEPMLSRLQQRGLMAPDADIFKTTDLGFRFLNEVIGEFLGE